MYYWDYGCEKLTQTRLENSLQMTSNGLLKILKTKKIRSDHWKAALH